MVSSTIIIAVLKVQFDSLEVNRCLPWHFASSFFAASLLFFGEKTSARQAFRRAKLKLFMVRSVMKSGGCHAIARQRDGGPHPHRTPHPSNAQKFPFPTISPAKGSFRTLKKPKILTDTNVTFRLPLDS